MSTISVNCISEVPDAIMDRARTLVQNHLENDAEWPADAWISIGPMWDLNLYQNENGLGAVLYPVRNGQTNTRGGHLVFERRFRRAWRDDEGDPRNMAAFDNPAWNGDPNEY